MKTSPLEIKVWGDFACFTRPEMKVERVSYDVMTPSAARNILQSIFWKPQFDYKVRQILVLKEINKMSILRNELKTKAAYKSVQKFEDSQDHYCIEDDHTQRHALVLRDVAYIIRADIALRDGVTHNVAKYRDQFRRRVKKGQCFWRPYLGCREFSAFFAPPSGDEVPIKRTLALGRMLFDLKYEDTKKSALGQGTPTFFHASLRDGVLHVPTNLYDDVLANKRSR